MEEDRLKVYTGIIAVAIVGTLALAIALAVALSRPAKQQSAKAPAAAPAQPRSGPAKSGTPVAAPKAGVPVAVAFSPAWYAAGGMAILFYFLPFAVALARHHPNAAAIGALTMLFGWTGIGWAVGLIWSLTSTQPATTTIVINQPPP